MKAVVATGYGSPDVLECKLIAKPQPKSNEILVKVKAACVTRADTMMRTGKPLIGRLFTGLIKPSKSVPGAGFSGVIEAVGDQVSLFKVGDEVFGESASRYDCQAEYLCTSEDSLVLKKPENLDFSEASTYGDGPVTSYNFLKILGEVNASKSILINGASGSLGMAAIQIGKYYGAHITAVCSAKNKSLVVSLGADEVIDYRKTDVSKILEKYDIIYDTVGNLSFSMMKNQLTDKGILMTPVLDFGILCSSILRKNPKKKRVIFSATGLKKDRELILYMQEIVKIFEARKLKTIIDRQYPIEKISDAHRYIDTGRKKGNVVLLLGS
ncbi:MAG: NAD(P)-dependent alcohol dehydrogenase [Flavobacteriales bacterium]|nr:NAD(P)-dependent alcohol dehydrogenase [Flavobacteriales bacterium]